MGMSPESSLKLNGISKPPHGSDEGGVGGKLHKMFRRRRPQVPGAPETQQINIAPLSSPRPEGEDEPPIIDYTNGLAPRGVIEQPLKEGEKDSVVRFKKEQKHEITWNIKPIEPKHIEEMIDMGWFKNKARIVHMKGDLINDENLPEDWNNAEQVARFRQKLHEYYFPGGFFKVDARDDVGNQIREDPAEVKRRTLIIEKNGTFAGMTSWLVGKDTGDPWSKDDTPRRSHTQMHWVSEDFSGQGFGLALGIARTDAIFGIEESEGELEELFKDYSEEVDGGYEEIVTWVNLEGNYLVNEVLFASMGYEGGEAQYINTTDPKKSVLMRRYVLKKDVWLNGKVLPNGKPVGREASIARWEAKKQGKTHREPNLG